MTERAISGGEVQRQNKRLKAALKALIEAVDDGPANVDTSEAREIIEMEESNNTISPPWERDGYDSKAEWQRDKRQNE